MFENKIIVLQILDADDRAALPLLSKWYSTCFEQPAVNAVWSKTLTLCVETEVPAVKKKDKEALKAEKKEREKAKKADKKEGARAVLLFSKLNKLFFGYFETEK